MKKVIMVVCLTASLLTTESFASSNWVCLFGGDPGCSLKGYVYWTTVRCDWLP